MPRPRGHLRILFSARVLLNLEDAHKIYAESWQDAIAAGMDDNSARTRAAARYNDFVCCRGEFSDGPYDPAVQGRRFDKGPLFDFALALAQLNRQSEEPLVEIGLSAKDEALSGITIFRNLDVGALGDMLEYRLLTCGRAITSPFHQSFGTDLFLSRNPDDVQCARDHGIASALINFPDDWEYDHSQHQGPLKIMVDGDGVAWGEKSEQRFRAAMADAGNNRD
ncbi:MAG TPA: 5'-nucleotidase, partial [Micavibrio sp.]